MKPPRWTAEQWGRWNGVLLAREMNRCACCGAMLRGRVERHHRQRRAIGGDRLSNLICLLPEHHAAVHAHPEDSREKGLIVSSYAEDPAAAPLLLWGTTWVRLTDNPDMYRVVYSPAL